MKKTIDELRNENIEYSTYHNVQGLFRVQAFVQSFKFDTLQKPARDVLKVRLRHMREELQELEDAIEAEDEYGVWDALVDLMYLAVGTVFMIKMPFYECFNRVHAANMRKIACETPEQSKRGELPDVYKPSDWESPSFNDLEKKGIF